MDLNGKVKCENCGSTNWTMDEDDGSGYVTGTCNNCGEDIFEKESKIEEYALRYDFKKKFLKESPCHTCGDIAWSEEDIHISTDDDGDDHISAKCCTCTHYVDIKLREVKFGKPIPNREYMHKDQFLKAFPCPSCKRREQWENVSWGTDFFLDGRVEAKCSWCGEKLDYPIKDLYKWAEAWGTLREFEKALKEHEQSAPWDAKYYDSPCPYCGAQKVRDAKWSDKKLSVAFWGLFASRAGDRFICDNCKKSWD